MNNKFNENEVRIDCNGNVIDRPFLYDYNKTMQLLGKQTYSWLLAPKHKYSKEFDEIMNTHFVCDTHGEIEKSLRLIIFNFAIDFFSLGVIVGKRLERNKNRKEV